MAYAMVLDRVSRDGTMGKKKSPAGPSRDNPSSRESPRTKGMQTLEIADVRALIASCQFELAEIEMVVDRAEKAGLLAITMDGATQLVRSLGLLQTFSTNIYRGLKKTMNPKDAT
jgi:hypothetical protein